MMHAVIEDNRSAILELCRKYHVERLDVFGSAAAGSFDPVRSDVDFLVDFQRTDAMNMADQYFGLLEDLETLMGRRVDLVCSKAMSNPYFIRSVSANRKSFYAA